jgi:hypothetical protein
MLFIVIDYLSKQLYLIPCYKTINTYDIAELFFKYIWYYKDYLNLIVLDYDPQFVSFF